MAWEERYDIVSNFVDGRDGELVGRNDDWVIPLRVCIDEGGEVDTSLHEQLNFLTSNSSSAFYDGKVYIFHGFINYVPTSGDFD